jgi:hypothetical protein
VVGNRDREERRDNEAEEKEGQPRSRFQVVKTLVGSLGTGQDVERLGIVNK